MIEQRLARFAPQIEEVVGQHAGQWLPAVLRQPGREQFIEHVVRRLGVGVFVEDGNAVGAGAVELVAEGVRAPAHRLPVAEQRLPQRAGVVVETVGVGGEHLAESATDIDHVRGEAAGVCAFDPVQAPLYCPDPLAEVAGVEVEGEPAQHYPIAVVGQQGEQVVDLIGPDTESAHRAAAVRPAETGQAQQHRGRRAGIGERGEFTELPRIVDIDRDTRTGHCAQQAAALRAGHLDIGCRETGVARGRELLCRGDIDGDPGAVRGVQQCPRMIHLVCVVDPGRQPVALWNGPQPGEVVQIDLWEQQMQRCVEPGERVGEGARGVEKGAYQRMQQRR